MSQKTQEVKQSCRSSEDDAFQISSLYESMLIIPPIHLCDTSSLYETSDCHK